MNVNTLDFSTAIEEVTHLMGLNPLKPKQTLSLSAFISGKDIYTYIYIYIYIYIYSLRCLRVMPSWLSLLFYHYCLISFWVGPTVRSMLKLQYYT